ncbi:hypothetical protein L6164_001233 [Bauhinia variegata]|uniref:Uncharacterized protein n=1 Tax=Bauhinia variegata TaxID=167791 RepID=A0ACB9Q989_BAUVA|nr:hypothetical protein L6164_001233 [Bauhinia variegata]
METLAKKPTTENSDGVDKISQLPDHILSSIISLLPLDEAVRTSTLANRWIDLWSSKGLKNPSICNPNLKVLEIRGLLVHGNQICVDRLDVLVLDDHLQNCAGISKSPCSNIFLNMTTLSIDVDFDDRQESETLSFILRSSIFLETLEIAIPVSREASISESHSSVDDPLIPNSMFWEMREMCDRYKLKHVCISGFKAREQELEFVIHLISNATKLSRTSWK